MPVTNPAPHAAVPLMLSVAASEALVVSLHRLLVLLAVAALPIREIRAACHAARAFRFSRHLAPPSKKPSTGFSLDGFFLFLLILSYQNQPSERNTNLCELMCSLVHFSVLFQNFFYIFQRLAVNLMHPSHANIQLGGDFLPLLEPVVA